MAPEPRTATRHRQPHTQKETTDHLDADDGSSSLLAHAWYSTSALAARLRVDASTLRRWRTARPPQGPPFVSVSERVVLYSALDVEEWLHSRRTVPGREA